MLLPNISPTKPEIEQYDIVIPKERTYMFSTYGWIDSGWAGNIKSQKSVSVISFVLAGFSIIYKTINQMTVALSTTEAEFYALSEAGKLALCIQLRLNELRIA